MKTASLHGGSLAVALVLTLSSLAPCYAIFGIFSKDKDRMPTKSEVAAHDRKAASLFASGEKAEEAGKKKKALGYFSKISSKYYFSQQYAPEATFRTAELLRETGEADEAFDYYQALVDRHRSSPRFRRAVEQQYNIAVQSLTAKQSSILGVIPKKLSRDRVIQMFNAVIANAPASVYAANGQYYIARIYEGQERYTEAIDAFQKVVDEYPRSQKAPRAQLKIAEIYEKTTRRADSPTNLRESREAYEDFITNFPQHQKQTDAFAQLNVLDEKEARKSLKVAKYYQNQGNMKAAAIYYKDVLRSNNAALKLEARQGIEAVSQADPDALAVAKIDEAATRSTPAERLKNQRNYLGPPAPDLVPPNSNPPRKATALVPSDVTPRPLPLEAEPPLPIQNDDAGGVLGVDVESLIPTPPPASADDILDGAPGSLLLENTEPDIDSLLPPIETEIETTDGDPESAEEAEASADDSSTEDEADPAEDSDGAEGSDS